MDDENALDGVAQQGHDRVDDPVTDDHLVRVVAGPTGMLVSGPVTGRPPVRVG